MRSQAICGSCRLLGGTQRCHDATYIVILDWAASQAEGSLNPLFVFQRDHQRAAPVEQDSSDSGHISYLLGGSNPRASHDPRATMPGSTVFRTNR